MNSMEREGATDADGVNCVQEQIIMLHGRSLLWSLSGTVEFLPRK